MIRSYSGDRGGLVFRMRLRSGSHALDRRIQAERLRRTARTAAGNGHAH